MFIMCGGRYFPAVERVISIRDGRGSLVGSDRRFQDTSVPSLKAPLSFKIPSSSNRGCYTQTNSLWTIFAYYYSLLP